MTETATPMPVPRLSIVNTNWGVNNIVSLDDPDIRKHIISTLETCSDLLKSHCGPLSGYAMLVNDASINETMQPSLFTRDGIRIISTVQFLSPIERYIKNLLAYIGMRVDSAAKDGTTTSMLWSAELLKGILNDYNERDLHKLPITIFHVNQTIDEVFEKVVHQLEQSFIYHVSDLTAHANPNAAEIQEVAGKIAFMQALSSSGGNLELATAMKEIFTKSPQTTWDYITFSYAGHENDKQFYVRDNEYDYRVGCINATADALDSALNTEYERTNIPVLVIPQPLAAGTGVLTELLDVVIPSYPEDHGLCILAPYFDGDLIRLINAVNRQRKSQNKITAWQYSALETINGKTFDWVLKILPAIAGVTPYDSYDDPHVIFEKHLFIAKRLRWHNKWLDFYGIVDGVDEANHLHPFIVHPEKATKYYTELLEHVTRVLAEAKDSYDKDNKLAAVYTEVINHLSTIRRPTLELGGTVHDQQANSEVAKDVLGAIMSTLNKGFLISGPLAIYHAIYNVSLEYSNLIANTEVQTATNQLARAVLQYMLSSISEVTHTVYRVEELKKYSVEPSVDSVDATRVHATPTGQTKYSSYINSLDGELRDLDQYISQIAANTPNIELLTTGYPVLQPATIVTEMLRRVHELVIKFMLTNKLVVSGGVMVNQDTDHTEGTDHGSH